MWPFQRSVDRLYAWDIAYFEHLIAEFNALDAPPTDPGCVRVQRLIQEFRSDRNQTTRSDLLEFEQTLLALQSTETLLQRAPILRLRYREVAGEAQYGVYQPPDISKLPAAGDAVRKVLLPDLRNLVSGIHWRYILLPLLDRVQTELTQTALWWILAYTVLWLIAVLIAGNWAQLPFLAMVATVVYAGIVGGYISALRRVQSVPADTDSLLNIQALKSGSYFLYLSPLLGAIFAIVLLLIFLGGLVGGTVFPAFEPLPCKDCAFSGGIAAWPFWTKLCPSSSTEYAKLFLWSFIAGFAERFVPDILDRVIERGQSASTGSISGANGAKPVPPTTPSAAPAQGEAQAAEGPQAPATPDAPAAEAAQQVAPADDAAPKQDAPQASEPGPVTENAPPPAAAETQVAKEPDAGLQRAKPAEWSFPGEDARAVD